MLNIYSVALVLTAGIAVLLGCIAVARLCRDHAFGALTSMAVVAQLFAVGVLSMTVWFGFPNFGIAVIAVAVAPSILLRPSLRPPATFFVVSGLMLVGAYNWWPLGLLVAPTLLVATWRLWHYAGEVGRRRARRRGDRVHGRRGARADRGDAASRHESPPHQRRHSADAVVARVRVGVRARSPRSRFVRS